MSQTIELRPAAEAPAEYVSLMKAAQRLDVSEDTLQRHIRPALLTGEIASLKIGSRRVISWPSLLAYLKHNHDGAAQ